MIKSHVVNRWEIVTKLAMPNGKTRVIIQDEANQLIDQELIDPNMTNDQELIKEALMSFAYEIGFNDVFVDEKIQGADRKATEALEKAQAVQEEVRSRPSTEEIETLIREAVATPEPSAIREWRAPERYAPKSVVRHDGVVYISELDHMSAEGETPDKRDDLWTPVNESATGTGTGTGTGTDR